MLFDLLRHLLIKLLNAAVSFGFNFALGCANRSPAPDAHDDCTAQKADKRGEQVTPRLIRNDGNQGRPFIGVGGVEPDIRFVRGAGEVGADDQLSTSLVAVEYLLDEDKRLVRRTRNVLDPGGQLEVRERKLLPGAQDIRFEFHDGAGWREDWSSAGLSIPRAVSIIATLPRYGRVRLQALTGL